MRNKCLGGKKTIESLRKKFHIIEDEKGLFKDIGNKPRMIRRERAKVRSSSGTLRGWQNMDWRAFYNKFEDSELMKSMGVFKVREHQICIFQRSVLLQDQR